MSQSSDDKAQTVARLPHLIHIGFPKAGSTFLQDWFAGHPQIDYKPGGLAGMWNIYDLIEASSRPAGDVCCRVTSAEQIAYPLAPEHFGSTDPSVHDAIPARMQAVCAALSEHFPDATILIVTRGFGPLLKSGYSELVRNGSHMTERDFLAQYREQTAAHPDSDKLARGYDYDACIALYREHFPDRVLPMPFELLVEDSRRFLGIIEAAMGLDPWDGPGLNVNPSLSPEELYWYPRMAKLLRLVPVGRIRVRLIALHRIAIAKGLWRRLIPLLRLVWGKRTREHGYPRKADASQLARHAGKAQLLVQLPLYAPYRADYGWPGDGDHSPDHSA